MKSVQGCTKEKTSIMSFALNSFISNTKPYDSPFFTALVNKNKPDWPDVFSIPIIGLQILWVFGRMRISTKCLTGACTQLYIPACQLCELFSSEPNRKISKVA